MKIFVWLIALLVGSTFAIAGEDRTYDPIGRDSIAALHEILIENGKCGNRNDCTVKQFVFYSSSGSGLTFTFYGVTEKEIVPRLAASLLLQAQKLPVGTKLVAHFISTTKEVDLRRGLLTSAPVFAEINVVGSYNSRQ